MELIYEDIFEAIRALSSSDPLLLLKDRCGQGRLQRHLSYNAITMPNGKTAMLPRGNGLLFRFFRGEREEYPASIPALYRNASETDLLLRRLQTIDFVRIAETFPQIYYAQRQNVQIDMLALAQHYELPTDFLDLTSDLSVAAFFATAYYDAKQKRYRPMRSGKGCIHTYHLPIMEILEGTSNFRFVGLQPFQRPGQQSAFGLKLNQGESLESQQGGAKVWFYHRPEENQKIISLFGNQRCNDLFPEELIAEAADKVKESGSVTEGAVRWYCEAYGEAETDVCQSLARENIAIVERPVFRLTRKQETRLRTQFRQAPFGDAPVYTRLMEIP